MKRPLAQVTEFHTQHDGCIGEFPQTIAEDRIELRRTLMQEELNEYVEAAKAGDIAEIGKELADVLYTVYGTIVEHGLHEHMEAIFDEVHASNMSKDFVPGFKAVKGERYFKADIQSILDTK